MQQKLSINEIQNKIDEFELFLKTTEKNHKTKNEYLNHFINWLTKKNEIEKEKKLREKNKNEFQVPQNKKVPFRFSTDNAIKTITDKK